MYEQPSLNLPFWLHGTRLLHMLLTAFPSHVGACGSRVRRLAMAAQRAEPEPRSPGLLSKLSYDVMSHHR